MNKSKFGFIFFISILLAQKIDGQAYGDRELQLDLGFLSRLNENKLLYESAAENNIKGSPYLSEQWERSVVKDLDDRLHILYLRYRPYDEIMEVRDSVTGFLFMLIADRVHSVTLGDRQFEKQGYIDGESIEQGYFEVIFRTESLTMYKKHVIKYSRGREIPALSKTIPPKFQSYKHYYAQLVGEPIKKIELKKGNILPLMGSFSKKVARYADRNNLSYKKWEELISILEYYEHIMNVK